MGYFIETLEEMPEDVGGYKYFNIMLCYYNT